MTRLLRTLSRWLALALIALIRFYQMVLSPYVGRACRFEPTCSHYGIEAIQHHGSIKGTWLTLCRVGRCSPLHAGGYDPVPKD